MERSTGGLPGGMVTFVFTDVEGSTRLFHRLGERFVEVLQRHREILRRVWSAHRGREVSAEGDEFFVAFADAADAVAACADAQRALLRESWPEGVDLRVRAGVHSGLASPQDGNYMALAVHQAKRVTDAAHGGQTLVSRQAAELAGVSSRSLQLLGLFRLRGFDDPIELFQLVEPGSAQTFPAIRALPAGGHNIVRSPTPTLGRDQAVAAITAQVVAHRVVTLIGPGGVGKSRLAAEVGMAVAPQWQDGVWMVDLSGVGEPELVAPAVASAIGSPTRSGKTRWDDVVHHLEARRAVIVLDNCEHVASACRDLVAELHGRCEQVAVIATSREPLRAAGEVVHPVEPLDVAESPEPGPEQVLASSSGRLFQERGAAVRPDFEIHDGNAAAVGELCRRLDGLPLLIELAASHLSAQTPDEILTGLEDRFRLLRSPDSHLPGRHRTVASLLDWSHDLLGPPEQAALRRLSLFAAGFSRETAIPAVAMSDIVPEEVAELIWRLVDRSLLTADVTAGETRYGMLETIRSYARRHLDAAGEAERAAAGLAELYLDRVGPWLPADRGWVEEMEIELGNLRALLPLLRAERQEPAQQLACSIGLFHDVAQSYRDGVDELTRLAGSLTLASPSRVALLATLGWLLLRLGLFDEAQRRVDDADALRAEYGAPEWDDAGVERTRGEISRRSGDPAGAVAIARKALERPLSDRGRARMYNLLGTSAAALGDFEVAYEGCRRELELYRTLGYEGFAAQTLGNLAEVALRLGDIPAAARHQQACLDLAVAQGAPAMVAFSLIAAARVAGWSEDWTTAAVLHARAEELLTEIGLVLYDDDQRQSEELLIEARERLGREAFTAAHGRGREMPIAEAVEAAGSVLEASAAAGA